MAVSLSAIDEVILYDDDPIQDDMLDRADVDSRKCDGQSYTFEFIGSRSNLAAVGIFVMVAGGLYLLYGVITFVRTHAL